jgi:hypothetical protein
MSMYRSPKYEWATPMSKRRIVAIASICDA